MSNPGGWPTGPLESAFQYDRRDLANAAADLWESIIEGFRLWQIVAWIASKV